MLVVDILITNRALPWFTRKYWTIQKYGTSGGWFVLVTRWMIGPQTSFWMKPGTLIPRKTELGGTWSWKHCSANFSLETNDGIRISVNISYIMLYISYKILPPWRECYSWIATHSWIPYALRNGCIQPSRSIWHVATRLGQNSNILPHRIP